MTRTGECNLTVYFISYFTFSHISYPLIFHIPPSYFIFCRYYTVDSLGSRSHPPLKRLAEEILSFFLFGSPPIARCVYSSCISLYATYMLIYFGSPPIARRPRVPDLSPRGCPYRRKKLSSRPGTTIGLSSSPADPPS